MEPFKTEGVILHALNFRDYDQILTVFTYTEGLVKGVLKGSLKRNNSSFAAPLTRIEFLYTKGNSDLLKLTEISPLSQYLQLRTDLKRLEAACDMSQALMSSQMPHHPAPDLYRLFVWSLDKIPIAADPALLALSFRLKLLRHDGVLRVRCECAICGKRPQQAALFSGEVLCAEHAEGTGLLFSQSEIELLEILTYLKNFNELEKLQSNTSFQKKVHTLFQEQI